MIPVLTPAEMGAVDRAATVPTHVLIERAGFAVAREARRMLGGTYGRNIAVIAGPGNNGADGRIAGELLSRAGARVRVVDARAAEPVVACDLVIDAAYGTGLRDSWDAPDVGNSRVLAVDIPSGIDGLSGIARGRVLRAERTVTFAALKPGLLFNDGPLHAGDVVVADIGLDVGSRTVEVIERDDVARWWPWRRPDGHKWSHSAVRVVAGSAGMTGAALLCSTAALRAGAGMVGLSVPGADGGGAVGEIVGLAVPARGWARSVLVDIERYGALVVGPGMGRANTTIAETRHLVETASSMPTLIDGDGLFALASDNGPAIVTNRHSAATVLTPHDNEFKRMTGVDPRSDRIAATRALASSTRAIVVLKGPTTVIADPDGAVRLMNAGDQRLATAGSGDVLAGIAGMLLATGLDAFDAASAATWLHAMAANAMPAIGLVASDIIAGIPRVLADLAQ